MKNFQIWAFRNGTPHSERKIFRRRQEDARTTAEDRRIAIESAKAKSAGGDDSLPKGCLLAVIEVDTSAVAHPNRFICAFLNGKELSWEDFLNL